MSKILFYHEQNAFDCLGVETRCGLQQKKQGENDSLKNLQ